MSLEQRPLPRYGFWCRNTSDSLQFMDEATNKIFELVNSSDAHEQMGGIVAIGTLFWMA